MATDALSLLFRIKADDQASPEIKKLRSTFDSETKAIESSGKSTFLKLGDTVGLTTTQMAGLAKALPLVGAAIAVVGGAAIAAGAAIFSLAKSTAEYGSVINDASLKTGLSAETLSGLDNQLKQSGASVEAFSRSVVFMQRYLEAAAEGGKEQIRILKALGIDPLKGLQDVEGAVRQLFLSLGKMEEGQRNAVGSKILGRGFQELSVFVEDTKGDLDGVIATAREMGLVMSQEAASAADEFADKMDELSNRSAAAGRTIGSIVIPGLVGAIDHLNASFQTIPDVVEGATVAAQALIATYITLPLQIAQLELSKLKSMFGTMGGMMADTIAELNRVPESGGDFGEFGAKAMRRGRVDVGQSGGGGKGKSDAEKREREAIQRRAAYLQLAFAETERIFRGNVDAENRLYQLGLQNLETYIAALKGANEQKNKDLQENFQTERENIDRDAKSDEDRQLKQLQLEAKVDAARVAFEAEKNRIEDLKRQREFEAERAQKQRFLALQDEYDRQVIQRLEDLTATGFIKEYDAEKIRQDLMRRNFAARKEILDFELRNTGEFSDRHTEIIDALILLEAQRADAIEQSVQRINLARARELPPGLTGPGTGAPNESGNLLQIGVDIPVPPPPNFDPWKFAFNELKAVGMSAFGSLAQGIGSLVQNLVLLGNTGGLSIRKFVASALASVAAQATMLGIMELAYAAAALTPWGFAQFGSPLAHLKSAAFFFAAAAVSGVLGRVTAGSSFAPSAGGAGASATGGGGSTSTGAGGGSTTRTIEQDRNQAQRIDFVLHLEGNDAFVVRAFEQDFRRNGPTRNLMVRMADG